MSIKGDWRAFPDPSKKNEPRNETRINAYEISYIVIIHFGKSPSFKSRDTVISTIPILNLTFHSITTTY